MGSMPLSQDIEKVKSIIEFEYENQLATTIPTKSSVTKIKQMKQENKKESVDENLDEQQLKEITFDKPKFLNEDAEIKISAAQRGTLIHLCMQKLNPKERYDLNKVKELINDLLYKKIISVKEAEAINPYKILEFTKSEILK